MENRKSLISITIGFLVFLFPFASFAYKPETTHKALTRDIIKFYSHFNPEFLSAEDKESVEKGAVEEDTGTRPLNHFYDPVYKEGLPGALAASDWALNSRRQSNLEQVAGANILITDEFSMPGDYSWERAVYEYVYGDRSRAMESLGHILHLIEDMTVPDHTRDDPHPDFVYNNAFGQESPYENFSSRFDVSTIKTANALIWDGLKPVTYSSINEYFDNVASYSNNNFFSKDTILEEKYKSPVIDFNGIEKLSNGEYQNFGYRLIDGKKTKLVGFKNRFIKDEGKSEKFYFINDFDNLVLTDYWHFLARQAVLNGAGVITLFFNEAEEEKKTGRLFEKNKSFATRMEEKIIAFFRSGSESDSNNIAAVASAEQQKETEPPEEEIISVFDIPAVPIQNIEESTIESPLPPAQPTPVIKEDIPLSPFPIPSPGFGGGMPTPANVSLETATPPPSEPESESDESPIEEIPPGEPPMEEPPPPLAPAPLPHIAIFSPPSFSAPFPTTTISFSGTAAPNSIISNNFSSATTSADNSGSWTVSLSGFTEGANTVSFSAEDLSGATSSLDVSLTVDTVAPVISRVDAEECFLSLVCVVFPGAVSLNFISDSPDISFYTVKKNGVFMATTTFAATTSVAVTPGFYDFELIAYDYAGNFSPPSAGSKPIHVADSSGIGYFCKPTHESTYIEGGTYLHSGGNSCIYLSVGVPALNKFGALYRGTVGSSTMITSSSLGSAVYKEEAPSIISSPISGEHFFTAIYETRTGPAFASDVSLFDSYFTTNADPAPHDNFKVLSWVYGP